MKRYLIKPVLTGALCLLSAAAAFSQTIKVATYNIRNDNAYDNERGNAWKTRMPYVAGLIRFHEFDVFGTQEALLNQLDDIKAALPGYAYTGKGRDDGKKGGEFAAIFYNTAKFRLLDEGSFWLSENPEKPGKGWDAAYPRVCSWAKLELKESKKTIYFFNVHFDHIGVTARKESAKLILRRIRQLSQDHTTILTGDFNVDQRNESYQLINTSNVLRDSYELSSYKYANTGTFNDFSADAQSDKRIDHIFLTKDFKVSKYGILTDTYRTARDTGKAAEAKDNPTGLADLVNFRARTPSDHFPVMAEISL